MPTNPLPSSPSSQPSRPSRGRLIAAPLVLTLCVGALVAIVGARGPDTADSGTPASGTADSHTAGIRQTNAAAHAGQTSTSPALRTEWLSTPSEAARMARVERKMPPVAVPGEEPLTLTLEEWMREFRIPGLSVAVFEKNQIVWAKSYGVTQTGGTDRVGLETLFQAGSISKPVAAMAALHFVEAGKWTLDENINDKLISWKLPENAFTVDRKVTLRRLLSHSAGTTVHGFPGYAVDEPKPTVPQLLDGVKPANTAPVRVDVVPGTKTRYSGGGTTIVQLMMVDQLKKPFPRIMAETVIDPLGLKDSTYEQPLPPARAAMTATGTYADGRSVEGRWHIYPEMAAAGLWTTASDLARIAIEVSKARAGASTRVLSQAMTTQMLTKQSEVFGLGYLLGPGANQFGHGGADEGFQAYLTAFSDSGSGVAIMANSDNGSILFERLAASVAAEYGWRAFTPGNATFPALSVLASRRGADLTITAYKALKAAGTAKDLHPGVLNRVGYNLLSVGKTAEAVKVFAANVELYPEDANAYDSLAEGQLKAGDKASAIANYKKTLQMNPKNEGAVKMLEQLGVRWTPEKPPQR